jgi:hypothetical protein
MQFNGHRMMARNLSCLLRAPHYRSKDVDLESRQILSQVANDLEWFLTQGEIKHGFEILAMFRFSDLF